MWWERWGSKEKLATDKLLKWNLIEFSRHYSCISFWKIGRDPNVWELKFYGFWRYGADLMILPTKILTETTREHAKSCPVSSLHHPKQMTILFNTIIIKAVTKRGNMSPANTVVTPEFPEWIIDLQFKPKHSILMTSICPEFRNRFRIILYTKSSLKHQQLIHG